MNQNNSVGSKKEGVNIEKEHPKPLWVEPEINGIEAKPITDIIGKKMVITKIEFRYHDVYRNYVIITSNMGVFYTTDKRLVNDFAIDEKRLQKLGKLNAWIDVEKNGRPILVSMWC
jgi:hypothetical protein